MTRQLLRVLGVCAVVLGTVTGAFAAEDFVYPPGAEPEEQHEDLTANGYVRRYDLVEVPLTALKFAHEEFIGKRRTEIDRVGAGIELQILALSRRLDILKMNLAWARDQDLDDDFIVMFETAIDWGQEVWWSDGANAWALAQAVRDSEDQHPDYKRLEFRLGWIAFLKDFPPAILAWGLESLKDPLRSSLSSGWAWIQEAADTGYEPAVHKSVEVFLTETRVDWHIGLAYYWLVRGERFGFDMSRWRPQVERVMTDRDRQWAEPFLREGHRPRRWEYD